MSDKVVSIRVPKRLKHEIEQFAKDNSYLDSSELVRSVLRRKYIRSQEQEKRNKE